ncbi:hypothetical protein [Inediibacterium massiliense]|uniref:hypothetical protein n=1 Tax=Inediibacterium massiliense TaxID=1658111 RepID=UPI0006B5FDFC|nr:hypothetical protein [Inediibacterium massiliense]
MRKGYLLIGGIGIAIIVFVILYTNSILGSDTEQGKSEFGETGSSTDIMTITTTYSNSNSDSNCNDELELQVAHIYKNINEDHSNKANRIIGKIEDKPITAKELELRALKFQANGSKNPYYDAWNAMKLNIEEERLAKKYGIDVEQNAKKDTENAKKAFYADSQVRKILEKQIQAYGITEEKYWELSFTSTKRVILHNRLLEYLQKNQLPLINVNDIKFDIFDKEYIKKIGK